MADLLDTNVVSELSKLRPHRRVVEYILLRRPEELFISVVTLAEIRFGIASQSDPQKIADLTSWLDADIRPLFLGRTFAVSEAVMLRWRMLVAHGRSINHTYSQPDLILAATAIEHGLTLVTRNTKDFVGLPGLSMLNPWTLP